MFRLIKITFKAIIIVLAVIGFNAIGGEKYVNIVKTHIAELIQMHNSETIKKLGDFSKLNEEFHVDNSVNLMGYKAVIAEHKASGQKMVILDSGKKTLLSKEDITGVEIDNKLKTLSEKFKYQGISVKEIRVTDRGEIEVFNQKVPYAKFEAKVSKLPIPEVCGIIASIQTSDGSEKLLLSINENKKYSQLIANEFFREIKEYSNN